MCLALGKLNYVKATGNDGKSSLGATASSKPGVKKALQDAIAKAVKGSAVYKAAK